MDKPLVLFYSKYCALSRQVKDAASQGPLKHKMVQICVDDKSKQHLPAVVKRVPTMIDRQSGDVFVGESIMGLFAQLSGGIRSPDAGGFNVQTRDQPHARDMGSRQSMTGGMKDQPHFQQPAESGGPAALNEDNGPYALMAGQASNTLEMSYLPLSGVLDSAGNDFSSKTGKGDGIESKYEQLMAERNMEGKGHRMM